MANVDVKLTINDLIKARNAMPGLNYPMPALLSRRVQRNFKKIIDALKEYDELNHDLFKKYGERKGQEYVLSPDNIEKYEEEIKPVLNDEEVVSIHTISLKDFVDKQGQPIEIPPLVMLPLYFMFDDDVPEND